jgi:uncharacterized membrane protein
VADDGQYRRCARDLVGNDGRRGDRTGADFLSSAAGPVDGLDAVGPAPALSVPQDWVTQVTIGLFMATFVYLCLVFIVMHQDPQSTFIPQISLITGWVLVVLSFGFLVYYSHRVARSIQNPDMIGAIVDDLYVAAGGAHVPGSGEGTGALPDDAAILRRAETGAIVSCPKSGYLQRAARAVNIL